jgi:hypothetical protein
MVAKIMNLSMEIKSLRAARHDWNEGVSVVRSTEALDGRRGVSKLKRPF